MRCCLSRVSWIANALQRPAGKRIGAAHRESWVHQQGSLIFHAAEVHLAQINSKHFSYRRLMRRSPAFLRRDQNNDQAIQMQINPLRRGTSPNVSKNDWLHRFALQTYPSRFFNVTLAQARTRKSCSIGFERT